ncbi:cyclophilin-like fold protein [Anaerorhabdus sp.]|uniref:cyclophilin-like fold protein n=1 Tax=Anaerorhabdus sp. TaxID=1872524 RepID=UPI002FC72B9E
MIRNSFKIIFILVCCFLLVSCINNNTVNTDTEKMNNDLKDDNKVIEMKISATINGNIYEISLEDNDTSKKFVELLPLTIQMDDLNQNEKYFYLDAALPIQVYRPGNIETGDFMLYGNNCLVLFYESFQNSYSYTKLGTMNNVENLKQDLSSNRIEITFKNDLSQ